MGHGIEAHGTPDTRSCGNEEMRRRSDNWFPEATQEHKTGYVLCLLFTTTINNHNKEQRCQRGDGMKRDWEDFPGSPVHTAAFRPC